MNTETKPDYEIARDELNKLFASLNLKVSISDPFGMVDENGWQCIRYTVTINGEAFTYSLGIGHIDWRKPYERIQRDHSDFNFLFRKLYPGMLYDIDRETIRVYNSGKKFIHGHAQRVAECAGRLAKAQKVAPNPAEVLACVCREGVEADESFANWCANFGGDTDSIKALNTYNACTENGKKARRILGSDNFQKFAELSARL